MLARLQVHLPFVLHLVPPLLGRFVEREIGGDIVRFHVPYRCGIQPGDLDWPIEPGLTDRLAPVSPQPEHPFVRINGQPVVSCDALQLDFVRDKFDRSPGTSDPSIELAFSLANSWLNRLRVLGVATQVSLLESDKNAWLLQYRNDDGTELERQPNLIRSRHGTPATVRIVGLTESLWDAIDAMPWGYEPLPSDLLLLDALELTEQVGPALVLGFTALETRIAKALDRLVKLYGVHPGLWAWIHNRNDPTNRPSIAEEFDSLLQAVAYRSLKEEQRLWEGFQNLRKARNSFVHEGVAKIGNDLIDRSRATSLLATAWGIIDWIEALLPEADRRPKYTNTIDVELLMPLAASASGVTEPDSTGDSGG